MPDRKDLLAANALIHQHGEHAEEHATTNLWSARQSKDAVEFAKWQALIDALKEVRALRKKT